jgi:tetratricopeptide (TPR) repeat protein
MSKKKISVFIASPGDVPDERRGFREEIDVLNSGFGDGADVEFEALGWEDVLSSVGSRNQSVINELIKRCDVFFLVMHRRWGQDAPDAGVFLSYTEEEFHLAQGLKSEGGKPEIFILFKRVAAEFEANPDPQLQKVMEFKHQLEESRKALYRYFDDEESFRTELNKHLRAYAKGEIPKSIKQEQVILPLSILSKINTANELVAEKAKLAEIAKDYAEKSKMQIEQLQLQLAKDAAKLSMDGQVEYAREKFSKLIIESSDTIILDLAYSFYMRISDLKTSEFILDKRLSFCDECEVSISKAMYHMDLSRMYCAKSKFKEAIDSIMKSIVISKKIGNKPVTAVAYSYLGNVYRISDRYDKAKYMYNKSLSISETIGMDGLSASTLNNLGIVYLILEDYNMSESVYLKSLKIKEREKQSDKRIYGQSISYNGLGNLYLEKKNYVLAERYYLKSIELNSRFGSKEGIANNYGNLGTLYYKSGDSQLAEESYIKSLDISIEFGLETVTATQYGNLANIYRDRDDFDRAEELYLKAIRILKEPDMKGRLAEHYFNYGGLYYKKKDVGKALEMYQKSLALYEEIDSPKAEVVQKEIDRIR